MHVQERIRPLSLFLTASDFHSFLAEQTDTEAKQQVQRSPVSPLLIGVDLGGTHTRAAVVRDAAIIARISHPTLAKEGPDAVILGIVTAIREVLEMSEIGLADIGGIGISSPGPLDPKTGVVFVQPNMVGWKDVHLRDDVAAQFRVPVFLGHDAALAALGEYRFGAGRGAHSMIYMTVSTGIGGGIIVNDQLIEGYSGTAGEIGHMYLDPRPTAPRCGAGHTGCLEALASGTALARDAQARVAAGLGRGILAAHREEEGDDPDEPVTARDVVEAAQAGDPEALEMLELAGKFIGLGCVNLAHILNPQRIVIGGGVTNAGDLLFTPITQTVHTRAFPRASETLEIVPASLGDDGGLLGAAAYVTYRLDREPK